jgi:DNA-binding response OmpR family regulator
MRLLLVDDDDGLRALLRTTFEVVDIEVEEARDSLEADAVIAARRPGSSSTSRMRMVLPGVIGETSVSRRRPQSPLPKDSSRVRPCPKG